MALPRNTVAFRREAPKYIERLMADFGLTDVQAAGFPGNFGVESAGFLRMQEQRPLVAGSRGGLGPAQWTGPRRRKYEAWLKRKRAKTGDFEADYGFLFRELKSGEARVVAALRRAATVEQAVEIVMTVYERPGVPHLERRIEWGRLALEAYRAGLGKAPAAPKADSPARKTVSPVPVATPETQIIEPRTAPATWWERLLGVRKPALSMVGVNRGDETLFRAQNQLLAVGYSEVGDPDGRWGPSTKTAIDAMLREQFPSLRPPRDWPPSDDILAAVSKARQRKLAAERADVTVAELRARGSTPMKAPVSLVGGGGLLSLLGLGKALQETGIPERITAVSDQASDILSSLQSVMGVLGAAFSLVFKFWWVLLPLLGLYWIAKGVTWALEIRALVRQGSIRQTRL